MTTKQIMFKDLENDTKHGGIQIDNGDVICGCCGGIFEADEQGETWEIIKSFEDSWVSLDKEICGDDWFSDDK